MQKRSSVLCEKNILDKYKVKISPKAYRELDSIYQYIAEQLTAPETALKTVDEIEKAILGLNEMPYRGSERKIGVYAKCQQRLSTNFRKKIYDSLSY